MRAAIGREPGESEQQTRRAPLQSIRVFLGSKKHQLGSRKTKRLAVGAQPSSAGSSRRVVKPFHYVPSFQGRKQKNKEVGSGSAAKLCGQLAQGCKTLSLRSFVSGHIVAAESTFKAQFSYSKLNGEMNTCATIHCLSLTRPFYRLLMYRLLPCSFNLGVSIVLSQKDLRS
jgi:hypothetical protein